MGFEEDVQNANVKGIITGAIISALGFLVALAWRDVIQETIKTLVPEGQGLFFNYLSAIIVTVIAVVLAWVIIRVQKANIIPDQYQKGFKGKTE